MVTRRKFNVTPQGDDQQLVVGKKRTLAVMVTGPDGRSLDLDGKALTVETKAVVPDDDLTFTFTADADQASNKGRGYIVAPAAQLTAPRVGDIYINAVIDDELDGAFTIPLVDNDAV